MHLFFYLCSTVVGIFVTLYTGNYTDYDMDLRFLVRTL